MLPRHHVTRMIFLYECYHTRISFVYGAIQEYLIFLYGATNTVYSRGRMVPPCSRIDARVWNYQDLIIRVYRVLPVRYWPTRCLRAVRV